MVFGTNNMWFPLIVSLISFEVSRCEMNIVVLNINGGGAGVLDSTPEPTPKPENKYFVYEYTGEISVLGAIEACSSKNGQAIIPETLEEVEKIKQLAKPTDSNIYNIPTSLKYENKEFLDSDSVPYTGSLSTNSRFGDYAKEKTSYAYLVLSGDSSIITTVRGDWKSNSFSVICERIAN